MADWETAAAEILPLLKHDILLLIGDLGAGKTTFTQSLLRLLESEDAVSSPTYSIVNEYRTPRGTVFHFDLYRLKTVAEAYDFGIEEYLDNGYLSIIEWPQIYREELQGIPVHELTIENTGNRRKLIFK
ncbi:MAG: tRNA (adenosine(37)-N6)-threonylcarbamoyltransferase complex ATPase subunit type 1 TsaE [Chryseobacterium sp.]|nr:MAG: tRNA (adenosine(37)-N6)-threonylcarbamoyltransferase complex ATPase subunit type 1 TsaE [Chryseobacterium sp.]